MYPCQIEGNAVLEGRREVGIDAEPVEHTFDAQTQAAVEVAAEERVSDVVLAGLGAGFILEGGTFTGPNRVAHIADHSNHSL